MGCCGGKQPCTGKKIYDVCVTYQGEILDWKLKEEDENCHNIQEVIEDIVDYLKESNTDNLGQNCLSYKNNVNSKITQKSVNETFEREICQLKDLTKSNEDNFDFMNCNLDYGDLLIDKCNKPRNLCQFYQFILDELKSLKNGN